MKLENYFGMCIQTSYIFACLDIFAIAKEVFYDNMIQ